MSNNNINSDESNLRHITTNWLSQVDQRFWFDQFKSNESIGLRFQQFQEFLSETLYEYFAQFPLTIEQSKSSPNDSPVQFRHQNSVSNSDASCKFSPQQEMQLFKIFDRNNDHLIDENEFCALCENWIQYIYHPACGLVVVDVQNDFIDGSLALINGPAGQDGAEVVPIINDLIESCNFKSITYTQDWHPIDHIGFHSNLHLRKYQLKQKASSRTDADTTLDEYNDDISRNGVECATSRGDINRCKLAPSVQIFDTVIFDDGQIEQKLWPVHCVQESWGAQLHPKLKMVENAIRIYKGTLANVDAYSAFWDNMRLNETGLRQEMISRNVKDLFFCGLALDYCVAASAIDSAKAGFITFVIEDACRGIDKLEMEHKREEMLLNGVLIVNSYKVKSYLRWQVNSKRNSSRLTSDELKQHLDQETIRDICFKRALL